ncbi:MAG: hypothetical protein KF729_18955 [Sandaracinaceae bacterium]|nr:hypothetical protein [Sandaracinaceae bacterium]
MRTWTFLWIAIGCAGCAGGREPSGDGGLRTCMNDFQCDDGFDCTIDACGVGNVCVHDPVTERCEAGRVCEVGRGCVTTTSCSSDADCDDAIACTSDRCGVGGVCTQTPIDERCGMGETCDRAMGCVAPAGCASNAECDDDVACTNDTCGVDRVCRNTPLDERCSTGESCHPTVGCYVPMPCTTPAECDDGNFCNGAELCVPEFGCRPADAPRVCDDSDACTLDSCDAATDMCVFACDTARTECGCPTDPPTCAGSFRLTGSATAYTCSSILGSVVVNVDFSTITMTNDGGVLNVRLAAQHFASPLADVVAPVCPNFEATAMVLGGCDEHYSLRGTFSDADNFSGTFSVMFVNTDGFSCSATNCVNQNISVTGRRM